eukprot:5891915-Amphidinium_carterae.1
MWASAKRDKQSQAGHWVHTFANRLQKRNIAHMDMKLSNMRKVARGYMVVTDQEIESQKEMIESQKEIIRSQEETIEDLTNMNRTQRKMIDALECLNHQNEEALEREGSLRRLKRLEQLSLFSGTARYHPLYL